MQNFIAKILMNKVTDGSGGGAPGDKTPPASPPSPETKQLPAAEPPAPKGEGDTHDDFGYPKAPKEPEVKKEGAAPKEGQDPPKDPAPKAPEDVKDPVTGYGKEPVVDPAPKKDEPPPQPPPEGLDARVKDLPKELQDEVKDDAAEIQKLKLAPEAEKAQIDRLVEKANKKLADAKSNFENAQREVQIRKQERNKGWFKELKEDPSFGGEKFDASVARSEKALAECLPRTKKMLTEGKEMVPPYLMRDLLDLHDRLNPEDKMVTGDPPAPEKKDEENNPLDFYQ